MANLTATQQSLIRRGLATPEDFGVVAQEGAGGARGLTATQQALVRRGLATPEEFAFTSAPVAAPVEAPPAPEPRPSLLDRVRGVARVARAGHEVAKPEVGRLLHMQSGRPPEQATPEVIAADEAALAKARADREAASARLAAATEGSVFRRTVGDVAGSIESFLGLPGAVAGKMAFGGPKGMLAGAVIGSALAARNMFLNSFAERYEAMETIAAANVAEGKPPGITPEEMREQAVSSATNMAINEYGTEVVTSLLPFARVIRYIPRPTLAKVIAARGALAVGSEGLGEVAVGAVANEIDRATALLADNPVAGQAAAASVESPLSAGYWRDRGREALAGMLGGAVMSPVTLPISIQEAREAEAGERRSLEQKLADRAKADAATAAATQGTPTAAGLADAFSRGVDDAAASADVDTAAVPEVDQLPSARNIVTDTRFDRATSVIDSKLQELDAAAEAVDTTQPLRLQQEASKAEQAGIDRLRTYIETAEQKGMPLKRNERRQVTRAIDRLNLLEQRQAGRAAVQEAKTLRSRLANAPDSELLTVAGEIDPTQDFTGLDGPPSPQLITRGDESDMPFAAANDPVSQDVADAQLAIARSRKKAEAAAKEAPEQTALKAGAARRKARLAFMEEYASNNPEASDQAVAAAADTWEAARQQQPAVSPEASALATRAAKMMDGESKKRLAAEKTARTKAENDKIRQLIASGITDPQQIADQVLAAGALAPVPDAPSPAAAEQDGLAFDDEAFLRERTTALDRKPGDRAAMTAQEKGVPEAGQDRARQMERANAEGGIRGAMNEVAEMSLTAGQDVTAQIARRLGPLLEAIGTKLEFPKRRLTRKGHSIAGLYTPSENSIKLMTDTIRDFGENLPEIAVHEGLHAVLQTVYARAASFANGEAAKAVLDSAMARLEQARASGELIEAINAIENPVSRERARILLSDQDGLIFEADGTLHPDEFIAYGMTSKDVQAVFKNIKMKDGTKKSIWNKFKDAARLLLDIPADASDSVLDRLMQGGEGLIAAAERDTATLVDAARKTQAESLLWAQQNRADRGLQAIVPQAAQTAEQVVPAAPAAQPASVLDRIADALAPNEAPAAERLMESHRRGAVATKDSVVERGIQAVERTGAIGRTVVNALVRKDARIPVTAREAMEAARNRIQAKTLESMSAVRRIDSAVRAKKGSMRDVAVINEFGEDFTALTHIRQAIRDNRTDKDWVKALDKKIEWMKQRWGDAYTMLEREQQNIDEQSMVIMEDIIRSAAIGPDGKRAYTPKQIRELNAIKANLGMYISREFANNSRTLQDEHRKAFADERNPKTQHQKEIARKYLRENALAIPDRSKMHTYGIDHLRSLASVWVSDMPMATKEEIIDALTEAKENTNLYNEQALNKVVESELQAIIDGRTESMTAKRYQSGTIDDSILKERMNIPQQLLPVMGEVRNAGLQLLTTLHRQSVLAERTRAYNEIATKLKDKAVFDNASAAPGNFVKLGVDHGALSGKFVHPNFAEVIGVTERLQEDFTQAFADPAQAAGAVIHGLSALTIATKAVILLPNAFAWAMNLYGSIMLPVATGSWRSVKHMPKSMVVAMAKMPGVWKRKHIDPDVLEVFKRGLEDSGHVAEITTESLRIAVESFRVPPEIAEAMYNQAATTSGDIVRLGFDLYASMDLWTKLAINYGEVSYLKSLNDTLAPNEKLTGEQIARTAAEWTKDVTPSYERTIPAANVIERAGLGFFLRFSAEVFRNTLNNFARAGKEATLSVDFKARGNTRAAALMMERSTSRLVGATAVTVSYPTIVTALSVPLVAIMQTLLGLEPEDDEDLKQLVVEEVKKERPWWRTKPLVVVGKDEKGYVVIDASRPLPQGPFGELAHKSIEAMTNPEVDYTEALQSARATFVAIAPPVAFILDLGGYRSRRPTWMRDPSPVSRFMSENQIPDDGAFGTALKVIDIFTPTQIDALLTDEAEGPTAIVGFRPARLDIDSMLQSFAINAELRESRRLLIDDLKQPTTMADKEEIKAIALQSIAVDYRRFKSVRARVDLALAAGKTRTEIGKLLAGDLGDRGAGLTRGDIEAVLQGNFTVSTLSESTLDAAMRELMAEEGADRAAIYRSFNMLRRELQDLRRAVRDGSFKPED